MGKPILFELQFNGAHEIELLSHLGLTTQDNELQTRVRQNGYPVPRLDHGAVLYQHLDYTAVRDQNLRVMDSTAITHCMEHNMPILVFNYKKDGNIQKAVAGEDIGTRIDSGVAGETGADD